MDDEVARAAAIIKEMLEGEVAQHFGKPIEEIEATPIVLRKIEELTLDIFGVLVKASVTPEKPDDIILTVVKGVEHESQPS